MNTRLSKKQMFFNKVKLTKDDDLYIGIDVHKESYGVASPGDDAPAIDFIMPADNEKLLKLSKQLRFCLDLLVQELQFLQNQLTTMEERLKQTFDNDARHTRQVALLRTHPGVGPVIARQYAAELFKPKRFKRATEVAKYVGLAPTMPTAWLNHYSVRAIPSRWPRQQDRASEIALQADPGRMGIDNNGPECPYYVAANTAKHRQKVQGERRYGQTTGRSSVEDAL